MPATTRFRQLSAPRQALVRLFQSINYGRIEDLEVRSGEPVFNPAPRVLIDVRLTSDEVPRTEHELGDFALSEETVRLMDRLGELGDGSVTLIEIRAGLPRRMVVEANRLGERR
jgi:hypothetical protein